MDLNYYFISFAFFEVLYLHSDSIGGWSHEQAIVFIAGNLLLDSIVMSIFANNMWWFPVFVNKGDLDIYLTRPVSTLFFVSLRDFSANSFVNFLVAIGVYAWALATYPGGFNWWQIVLYTILIFNGATLYYMLNMIFYFPVFWTGSPRGFGNLYWILIHSIERPDRIYKGMLRLLLVTALPFCLMISFPARLILEEFDTSILMHILGVSALAWPVYLFLWSRGLKVYSSASS